MGLMEDGGRVEKTGTIAAANAQNMVWIRESVDDRDIRILSNCYCCSNNMFNTMNIHIRRRCCRDVSAELFFICSCSQFRILPPYSNICQTSTTLLSKLPITLAKIYLLSANFWLFSLKITLPEHLVCLIV